MTEPPPALRIGSTAYLIPRNTDRKSTAMVWEFLAPGKKVFDRNK